MKVIGRLFLLLPIIFCLVFASLAQTAELIVDNGSTGTSSTGTWFTVSNSNAYGGNWVGNTTGEAAYTFEANVSGSCEVFSQWSASSNRCAAVPIQIKNNGALLDAVSVNQQVNHFQWTKLGTDTYDFSSGIAQVTIIAQSGCQTNTDGVKFTCNDAPPPPTGETVNKRPLWEITQDGTDRSINWVDHAPNPRFAIYNDLVLDKETGLVWTRFAATGIMNSDGCAETLYWEGAVDCPTFSVTGDNRGGWRLPSVEELGTLWQMNPAVWEGGLALPNGHPFVFQRQCDWDSDPSCEPMLFWTSTTSTTGPSRAFAITFQCETCFFSGDLVHHALLVDKSAALWWWAVRGGK